MLIRLREMALPWECLALVLYLASKYGEDSRGPGETFDQDLYLTKGVGKYPEKNERTSSHSNALDHSIVPR